MKNIIVNLEILSAKKSDRLWYAKIIGDVITGVIKVVHEGEIYYSLCSEFTNGSKCYFNLEDVIETANEPEDEYKSLSRCFHH